MATNSRRRSSLGLVKVHDCRMKGKIHRTQTLCCAVVDYLMHLKASGRKTTTIDSYAESLALLGKRTGTDIPLLDISSTLLNAAVAGLTAIEGEPLKRRSQTTLNRHRSAYRGFFGWTVETNRIHANPALLLGRSKMESVPTQPMTMHEVHSFLWAICQSDDPLRVRDEALFALYAFTGLRRAEALQVDEADYNVATKTLRVRNGKSGRPRTVHVIARLGVLLERLLSYCGPGRRIASGKLFPGRGAGDSLTARQAQSRFQHWKGIVGLRSTLTIHSFRVGFATALHQQSRDVVLVSRALGHGDLRPTLRYIDLSAGELPDWMESTFR